MTGPRHAAAAVLALAGLAGGQAAEAAAPRCVSGAEVASLFVYSVPPAVEAVRNTCGPRLKNTGFLATGGRKFVQRYAALQDETWPKARRALLSFAAGADPQKRTIPGLPGVDPLTIAQSLPDDVARPLVETLIMQKVAEQVKPGRCGAIEQVLAAAAPFEPRDAGMLLGSVMNLVGLEQLDIDICKTEES